MVSKPAAHKRFLPLTLSAIFLTLHFGCTSLESRIERLTEVNAFPKALILLEKKKVGVTISPDATPEALQARAAYTKDYEFYLLKKIDSQILDGSLRSAAIILSDFEELCPWSPVLRSKSLELQVRITKLDDLAARWKSLMDRTLTYEECGTPLSEIRAEGSTFCDNPILSEIADKCWYTITSHWANQVESLPPRELPGLLQRIRSDGRWALNDGPRLETITRRLAALTNLHTSPIEGQPFPRLTSEQGKQLLWLALELYNDPTLKSSTDEVNQNKPHASPSAATDHPAYLSRINKAIAQRLQVWVASEFIPMVTHASTTFDEVTLGEDLLAILTTALSSQLPIALASGHTHCARSFAGEKRLAYLALLHLARAAQLNSQTQSDISLLRAKAEATLSSAERPTYRISVDADPNVDPELYRTLRSGILAELRRRSGEICRWLSVPTIAQGPDVRIYISYAKMHLPDPSDLLAVHSTYQSHVERVPNPRKASLKRRLSYEEGALSSAKSQYESAVSSHNIYRTEYSLSSANSALTYYKRALDNYNDAVDTYNRTPATVEEPVFLPYVFREGTVAFGVRCVVKTTVKGRSLESFPDNVQRDLVRLGTRFNDRDASRRRDDGLGLDTGAEAYLRKLEETVGKIADSTSGLFIGQSPGESPGASSNRDKAIAWLEHPFGPSRPLGLKVGVPLWGVSVISKVELPKKEVLFPELGIAAPPELALGKLDLDAVLERYANLVCDIQTLGVDKESIGSGVLISGDGLILTCAHVLEGESFTVGFIRGGKEVRYRAVVEVSNERADSAIVRAIGLTSADWAPLRMLGPIKNGEAIVAIGNPSLVEGQTARGAVSKGVVALTTFELRGQRRLICDITVASGSSGGPIISLDDGNVIGTVLAVQRAGINQRDGMVSASGYSCVAMPAPEFQKALGLRLLQKKQP